MFMIMEPGKRSSDWKGVRVYLKMKGYETSGENLEKARVNAAKAAGEEAAKALHAVVTLAVEEVRPIVDSGQGWEKSI